MKLSIGVTGHRDLVEDEKPALKSRVRAFFSDLKTSFPGLELQLVTPLAKGADTLVSEIAIEMGIELIAVLPMQQALYEQDFSTAESLENFRSLLGNCRQTILLPLVNGERPESLVPGSRARDLQYAQMGLFVSNHCQILLALWDGNPSDAMGGTAQVVRYHLTGVMEGLEVDQTAADLLANNENDLVYQIVCSRAETSGDHLDDLALLGGYWITSLHGRVDSSQMPAEYHLMLERVQEYDDDGEKYEEEIEASGITLLIDLPPLELPSGVRQTDSYYRAADWLALHFQKRVHLSLRWTYLLAVLMGLVFLLYAEFSGPSWMVMLFLGLFFSGVVIHLIGERRQWHRKYLDYRALAEGLRVQIYWNLSGVVDPSSAGFAYDSFLNKQDVELGWIRHVMRAASMQRLRGEEPDPRWVDWVVDNWVGQEHGGKGQLAYYTQRSTQNTKYHRRTGVLGTISLWAGITAAFLLLILGSQLSENQMNLMMVLMGALPLIAGVRDAYAHKKAEKELIRQYTFMGRVFDNARKLLESSNGYELKRRVLRALGEAALEEGAEWILMHRDRPPEYSGLQ